MKAFCLIRRGPPYRNDAFLAGLKAAGYDARAAYPDGAIGPGDVLLTWNRYGETDAQARKFEAKGGTVIVAENGYLARPHYGGRHYALAVRGHNGIGAWPSSGLPLPEDAELGSRFDGLGLPLAPWRQDGRHILVCPNRAFGMPGYIMPHDWAAQTVQALRGMTKRAVKLREHPGNGDVRTPIAEDLAGAWCCVIWSSSAGVHALAAGVPVIAICPAWILKKAAGDHLHQVDDPPMDDVQRRLGFERLAWAQWTLDEIVSGLPFRLLARKG